MRAREGRGNTRGCRLHSKPYCSALPHVSRAAQVTSVKLGRQKCCSNNKAQPLTDPPPTPPTHTQTKTIPSSWPYVTCSRGVNGVRGRGSNIGRPSATCSMEGGAVTAALEVRATRARTEGDARAEEADCRGTVSLLSLLLSRAAGEEVEGRNESRGLIFLGVTTTKSIKCDKRRNCGRREEQRWTWPQRQPRALGAVEAYLRQRCVR